MKELDGNLPSEIEEFLKKNSEAEKKKNKVSKSDALAFASESVRKDCSSSLALAEPDAQEPAEVLQNAILTFYHLFFVGYLI